MSRLERVDLPLKLSWRLSTVNATLKITKKELFFSSLFSPSAPLIHSALHLSAIDLLVLASLTDSREEGDKERRRESVAC